MTCLSALLEKWRPHVGHCSASDRRRWSRDLAGRSDFLSFDICLFFTTAWGAFCAEFGVLGLAASWDFFPLLLPLLMLLLLLVLEVEVDPVSLAFSVHVPAELDSVRVCVVDS